MGDRLTSAQVRALNGMTKTRRGGQHSAYGLGVPMATMRALTAKQYVKVSDPDGWIFSLRTCNWRITPAGIAALARQEETK